MGATRGTIRTGSIRRNPSFTDTLPISSRYYKHPIICYYYYQFIFLKQFLGSTDVDQPKGIEVVKEGIRKLRFSQQLRKAEGQRTPKVELTVSVDGVAIQEPKGKV